MMGTMPHTSPPGPTHRLNTCRPDDRRQSTARRCTETQLQATFTAANIYICIYIFDMTNNIYIYGNQHVNNFGK